MLTETSGNSLLSRLKNVFSSSEPAPFIESAQENSLSVSDTDTLEQGITGSVVEMPQTESLISQSVIEREISLRTVEVSAPRVTMPEEKDLDIRFATSFSEAGGKFVFCETIKEAVQTLKLLKSEEGWSHVFFWENEIRDAFLDNNFQKGAIGFTIENSDAAISLCENLIADDGTIILNPKQASRRRLPCFPKTHIILTDIARLAGSETEGLEKFYQKHKGELPSIIKLGSCNKGHFYDKQRLILNAEGPENVYVFLIDEIIPASLRP